MSAYPDSEIQLETVRRLGVSRVQYAAMSVGLAVLGLSTIWPTMLTLWLMWTTDALKSIGMVIPVVSLALVVRAWRRLGWEAEGTWWGLALVVLTAMVVWIRARAILILVISPHWTTTLPPPSLVLFVYGSGTVLLLGGTRLYRAALFPIVLLIFANPIPHVFSLLVDLPLQHASAYVARAFAMHLGHSLTPDNLRLMFTPDFGMFIAPGCDGIRGSITMGYIGLIAGYVYQFRWYSNALVTLGATLLGYVFNLARLCMLVLYYAVALHFPSLQDKAENADYVIGASLFLVATLLLFTAIQRLRERNSRTHGADVAVAGAGSSHGGVTRVNYVRLAAMGMIGALGCIALARGNAAVLPFRSSTAQVVARFPEHLGGYTLVRSWNETLVTGPIVYVWGQYVPSGGGTPVAIGISPRLGLHDPLMCHTIRGENPVWQGPQTFATVGDGPVNFSSAFYDDGVTQHLEASTQCSDASCGEFATARTHFGLIYSHPSPRSMFSDDPPQPIPILMRVETTDTSLSGPVARAQLTDDLRRFLGGAQLSVLTQAYNR
ncbi:MAG TPA: exosortase J [Acidobacteriaceae bacterium]|jgi:exosortase J